MVVRLLQVEGGFPLLIGRPWLRHTKALHDWGSNFMWIPNAGGSHQSIKLEEGIDPSTTQSALAIQSASDIPPPHFFDDELLEWLAATEGITCYGITVQPPCGKPEPDGRFSPSIQISKSTKVSHSSEQMYPRKFLPIMVEVKPSLVATSSQGSSVRGYKNTTGVPSICAPELAGSADPIINVSSTAPKCLKKAERMIKNCKSLTTWVLASSFVVFALLNFIGLSSTKYTLNLRDMFLQSPQITREQTQSQVGESSCQCQVAGYASNGALHLLKDESVRLWNVNSGVCILIFAGSNGHRNEVLSVDFHPSNKDLISSCGMDNTVKIWSLKDFSIYVEQSFDWKDIGSKFPSKYVQFPEIGRARLSYAQCKSPVRQTAMSFDGSTILCSCEDGSVWRWDAISS
ncbi:hypothetical protein L7F22_004627 [Adiantum nelumboides]|nr:hypothetical protein [Adiantum nelumboides]